MAIRRAPPIRVLRRPDSERCATGFDDERRVRVWRHCESYFVPDWLSVAGIRVVCNRPDLASPGNAETRLRVDHTLFIEFSDLAVLDSPSLLATLFKLPSLDTARSFSNCSSRRPNRAIARSCRVRCCCSNDSRRPCTSILTTRYGLVGRATTLSTMWCCVCGICNGLRLRRSFRFCTLTTRDRSQEGMLFDLQLCGESVSRLRFAQNTDGTEATSTSTEPWLAQLVDYANCLDGSEFREALRRLGLTCLAAEKR